MDRRSIFANERVAHLSLRGHVQAARFAQATAHQVIEPKVALLEAPHGKREREILLGETLEVLEVVEHHAFARLRRDGYVGYVPAQCLAAPPSAPTHYVSAIRSYAKPTPDFKADDHHHDLSFGARLTIIGHHGNWSEMAVRLQTHPDRGLAYFVPTRHLAPITQLADDPAAIAAAFLGTPYVWGGNSAFGIDCSGLVQAALLACGIPCPGDSDLQQAAFAPATGAYLRGDLLFWKGHVAMVVDSVRLIHANAHHMAVAYEGIAEAIARIDYQGDGPVTAHKRPISKGSS